MKGVLSNHHYYIGELYERRDKLPRNIILKNNEWYKITNKNNNSYIEFVKPANIEPANKDLLRTFKTTEHEIETYLPDELSCLSCHSYNYITNYVYRMKIKTVIENENDSTTYVTKNNTIRIPTQKRTQNQH